METLQTPEGIIAVSTAVAGVIIYTLAPKLPSLIPPSGLRLAGFAIACMATLPLWAYSGSLVLPAFVGAGCLIVMAIAHLVQTRKR